MNLPPPITWVKPKDRAFFGKDPEIEWRDDEEAQSPLGQVGIRAARVQHEIIRYVGREMRTKGWYSWAAVAEQSGIDIKAWQMTAIARGDAHIRMQHIAALDVHFGPLLMAGHRLRREMEDAARWRKEVAARVAGRES